MRHGSLREGVLPISQYSRTQRKHLKKCGKGIPLFGRKSVVKRLGEITRYLPSAAFAL